MVRVEIRQRHHRDDLAGAHVHDDAGGALGAELADDLLQLLMEDELHPGVDRQLHRAAALTHLLVERAFEPGEPVVVDAAEPDDMRRQIAERIDPALLVLELQARDAEPVDLVLLPRRQLPLDPRELLPELSLACSSAGLSWGNTVRMAFVASRASRICRGSA